MKIDEYLLIVFVSHAPGSSIYDGNDNFEKKKREEKENKCQAKTLSSILSSLHLI